MGPAKKEQPTKGTEVMSTYHELNAALMSAIQQGRVDQFIGQLNSRLTLYPSDYLAWLFLSRAYEAEGDTENAARSYDQLMRLADPDHPNTQLLIDEIRSLCQKTRALRFERELRELREEGTKEHERMNRRDLGAHDLS